MNSQSTGKNSQISFTQIYANLFTTQRARALLFIGSLVIALIISAFVSGIGIHALSGITAGLYLIYFPAPVVGLIFKILPELGGGTESDALTLFFIITMALWLVYLGIIITGVVSKNLWVSKILFLVFAVLLILNITGCTVD